MQKPLMIAIHCGGMPFNGRTIPSGKSLGGSESAAYYMARELAQRGHKVVVFTASKEPCRIDDVIYDSFGTTSEAAPLGDRFTYAMRVPWDVVVVQRHPLAFATPMNSKLNIWWLHDLALHRFSSLVERQLPFIDQIFAVSDFHKKQVSSVYGISEEFITATLNGMDYSQVEQIRKAPPQRDRRQLVFASRPERGLEELVAPGGIMEKLPDFQLAVCGYDNTTEEMAPLYHYLWGRCEELPNVKNYGHLGKDDLYQLLARSGAYIYPTNFEDTSNILLLEANSVGTPFIGPSYHAALQETAKGGGFLGVSLKDDLSVDRDAFASSIKSLLSNDSAWERLSKKALEKHQPWSAAAEQWEDEFYQILAEKSADKVRLTKHLERMSDIEALMRLHQGDIAAIEKILPDFRENYDFWIKDNFREHYRAYYEYEAKRGVVYGPEELAGNARFEHTCNVIAELKPKSLLDYGCAHGHYAINIAKRMPGIRDILGVDIEESNIEKARAWALKDGVDDRTEFIVGTAEAIPSEKQFDLILVCEVLEHVKDPAQLIESLKAKLSPGGYILLTTPYGPWEAIGYREHKGWRAHLHHFERWDLFELFGSQPEYKLLAIPHSLDLGHHLVYFKAGGAAVGDIDYRRKLTTQAPRETVSLCMIVKNGETTLGRTLEKASPLVDEILVQIDEQTDDETLMVAEQFVAKVSWAKSPMEIGFDAARNLSIAEATGDWILWLDSDELFERTENVFKYLRRSPLMGLGVPQHHFSEEPPGILKTDFPCRLFRNRRGIKFFGLVHEHPEAEINKGPGRVVLAQDFGIMHVGYSTEAIRRRRFERNWPLMQRDVKKYPDRTLGQFLWMRDLSHMCKYLRERTGGVVTPEVRRFAEEAIRMWDTVLGTRNVRMISDGLQFYSEAVMHLLNGNGIEYALDVKARRGPIAPTVNPMRGYFLNAEAIKKFAEIVTDEVTKIYSERYF